MVTQSNLYKEGETLNSWIRVRGSQFTQEDQTKIIVCDFFLVSWNMVSSTLSQFFYLDSL